MTTNIGISELNRQEIADELSKILADEFILYTKTKNAHWNVEGIDFYDKHKFFESQFEQLDDIIDSIAERTRSLGHYAPASLKSFLSLTNLSETTHSKNDSKVFISELLSDHENIIKGLRENINRFANEFNDFGTSDFITGLMQDHEKMAWFLRSHI
jgi:starvation-inducible DNA-binding protein